MGISVVGCSSTPRGWESRSEELLEAPVALADNDAMHGELIRSVSVEQPFSELLVSWNISASAGSTAVIEVRGRREPGEWGPWLRIGWQGERPGDPGLVRSPEAMIDVDYLRATGLLSHAQCRVRMIGGSGVVHRLSVVTTAGRVEDLVTREVGVGAGRAFTLPMAFISQKTERPELSGRLCSPTSLAMVMGYFGASMTVLEAADRAYDPTHDLYGNWPRNIAAGFSFGVPGRLFRFSNWNQAERVLRSGRPIVASIFVEPGQLRGAPYRSTDGHLIVLRGIDASGDLMVLDPAASDERSGSLVYRRDDLTTVWLSNTKGTAYLFDPAPADPPVQE